MPLYEIVKADGTREKVLADEYRVDGVGGLEFYADEENIDPYIRKGTWLEVWRREGVGE